MLDSTKFDALCEQAITSTTKMFYPRNLKFSEKFLAAFKEEYNLQKKTVTEEKGDKAFSNHFERMLKGLRFEAKKIEDSKKPKSKQKPKLVEGKIARGYPHPKTNKPVITRHRDDIDRNNDAVDAAINRGQRRSKTGVPGYLKREIDMYLDGDPNVHEDFFDDWIHEFLSSVGFPEAEDFKPEIYDYLKRRGSLVS